MDADGTTVSAQTQRAAFDPYAGLALPGFGENIDGDAVEHVWQVFKFPIGVAHATVEVPGSIVGSGQATVEADRVYADVRTLWVKPETGVIIKGEERQNSALRFRDDATVTTEATIGYDDRTVSENATEYGEPGRPASVGPGHGATGHHCARPVSLAGGLVIRRSGTGRPGRGRIRSRLRRRV